MGLSPLGILSSIAIFLLCFLAVILIISKNRKHPGRQMLGVFLLLNGLNFLGGLFFISDLVFEYPELVFWTNVLPLTFGPLLWFYTRSLINGHLWLPRVWWAHFLPFLLIFSLMVISYHIQPEIRKIEILKLSRQLHNSLPVILSTLAFYLHVLFYVSLTIRDILSFRKEMKNQYSSIRRINTDWWITLTGLYALLLLSALVNSFFGFSDREAAYETSLLVLSFTTLVYAAFFLYRAVVAPFSLIEETTPRYAGSPLEKQEILRIEVELDKLMMERKLFCEPDLSVQRLAEELGTSGKWLSQVINQQKGLNFFDYINRMRIEEAAHTLSSDSKITVLEVMYACGFNSKSSFNMAFRKYIGQTPTQYRKEKRSTS